MNNTHPSRETIQLLIDRRLGDAERPGVEAHLSGCTACKGVYEALVRVDAALRRQQLVAPRPGFTADLMEALAAGTRPTVGFRLVENLAYLFGLAIVAGMTLAVLLVTGTIGVTDLQPAQTATSKLLGQAGEIVSAATTSLTGWFGRAFPFALGEGSAGIALFGLATVAILALLDRFLQRRVVQRLR